MYMDIYRALSTAACGLCLGRGGAGRGLQQGAGSAGRRRALQQGAARGPSLPFPKVLPRAPAARREVPTPGGAGPCPLPLPGRSVPAAGGAVTALPGRGMALVTVRRAPGSAGVPPVVSGPGAAGSGLGAPSKGRVGRCRQIGLGKSPLSSSSPHSRALHPGERGRDPPRAAWSSRPAAEPPLPCPCRKRRRVRVVPEPPPGWPCSLSPSCFAGGRCAQARPPAAAVRWGHRGLRGTGR